MYFHLTDVHSYLVSYNGLEFADKYIYLYKKYGKKIIGEELNKLRLKGKVPLTNEEFTKNENEKRKKEKELLKKRLKTGERFKLKGLPGTFSYEKINTVQTILRRILPNVDFYNRIISAYKTKEIALIYKNELINLMHLNHLFYLNDPDEKNSINDKLKCLIILYEGNLNAPVEILNISDVKIAWDFRPQYVFNKELTAKVNNLQTNYYLIIENKQFLGIAKKSNERTFNKVLTILKYIK